MKKLYLFLFTIISAINTANAGVFTDEIFNYSVLNLIDETSWTTAGTLTTGTGRNIISSALTYSNNGKTYILSGEGKTLNSDISSCTDYKSYKPFSTSSISTDAVYMSFMYKAGVAQGQTNSEVMGMADGTNQGPRLWAGKGVNNTSNFRFGLTRGVTTSASIIWGTTEYSDVSATMLIVIKYDFATSTASIFINPELGTTTEPTADIIDNTTTTFRTQLNNMWIRSQGSSAVKFNVGGIRVASTWAEVVADKNTPKLDTPVVGAASDITESGFTANWSTVENAIGYSVLVYQGPTLVSTTFASGLSTSSLIITGLTSGAEYTYKVLAKGNGADFTDSDTSASSLAFSTIGVVSTDRILTNFGDGTWGTVETTSYTSGNYPTSTVNGFSFVKAFLYTGTVTCATGETHINRILLDKNSQGAVLEFPPLTTVGEVQIHAATGTDAMSFRLEELVGSTWTVIDTYTTRKSPDSIYVIPVLRNSLTKLRIANNTGSGLYVYKIVTLTYQEATELTLRSSSPVEGDVVYSNLKKTLNFTFNKNVNLGNGTILLNDTEIPLNTCILTNNIVTVPVTLTTNPGSNKNYTLKVSAGAFVETGNPTNLSKAISINFQTLKSVAYPTNYNGIVDIVYKNVNSENTRMDVYYPTNPPAPVPVIINMHGGGWNHGYKEDQGGFSVYFNMGFAVANVEYRMTGETQAPAAVEDVRGAMIYLLNHAQELNIDPMKIVFQGGSAGGHLALIAGYLRNNPLFDNDCTPYTGNYKVMAVIDKYGPSDLTNFMFYTSLVNWLGTHASDQAFIDSLSPINYVNSNTPATYIIHGDADPTVPYSQSVTLYAALQTSGVKSMFTTVLGGGHGGFSNEYNTQMENEITAFLNEVLSAQETENHSVQSYNAKISVFGNNLQINSSENVNVTVFNCLGNPVLNTQNKHLELSQSGVYIVKVKTDTNESISKIIIR